MEVLFMTVRHLYVSLALSLGVAALVMGCGRARQLEFRVTLSRALRTAPADGRLMLLLSKDHSGEPRLLMKSSLRSEVTSNKNARQIFEFFGTNVDGLRPDGSA